MTNKLQATVIISGKIECITGLHIGGTGSGYEIGGIDNPVIRNPDGFPYIPGSSLKGKMRSMLEWAKEKVPFDGDVHTTSDPDDDVCRIFGAPAQANRNSGPTRLIVRDAVVDQETFDEMRRLEEEEGLPKVEVKTEVKINRITSSSEGLRQMERVPVGSKFDFELVYFLMDVEGLQKDDLSMLKDVFLALKLVEDSNLGGSGSRGSGQVRFLMKEPRVKTANDYFKDASGEEAEEALTPLADWNDAKIEEIISNIREKIS